MLFLPLIENAYKHSATKDGENIIQIEINIDDNSIMFVANNEYDSLRKTSATGSGGLGLNIVKRRLELIYPSKHSLKVTQDANRYNVELKIQLYEY
jgi:LytS/YehU family sensor histidine kinase